MHVSWKIILLRQRETEIAKLDRQVEVQETISPLDHNLRTRQDQIVRRESRVLLTEREFGFFSSTISWCFHAVWDTN